MIGIFLSLQVTEWNQRRERAITTEVFAQSILDDLETDVIALETSITYGNNKSKTIDEFRPFLKPPRETWNELEFYKKANVISSLMPFSSTDVTYQQLRASGSLQNFDQLLNIMLI